MVSCDWHCLSGSKEAQSLSECGNGGALIFPVEVIHVVTYKVDAIVLDTH